MPKRFHSLNLIKKVFIFSLKQSLLPGGINPSNVKKYIECVKPFAIDVISGVEKEKGKKDKEKVEEMVK
ncbi:MAG: hypothetical protein KAW82_03245, partial [Desulfurellaceae bacterium]|nr:hypothetical protein [Desulfurellaceae bacterium]